MWLNARYRGDIPSDISFVAESHKAEKFRAELFSLDKLSISLHMFPFPEVTVNTNKITSPEGRGVRGEVLLCKTTKGSGAPRTQLTFLCRSS
jgi:hypothetical protein